MLCVSVVRRHPHLSRSAVSLSPASQPSFIVNWTYFDNDSYARYPYWVWLGAQCFACPEGSTGVTESFFWASSLTGLSLIFVLVLSIAEEKKQFFTLVASTMLLMLICIKIFSVTLWAVGVFAEEWKLKVSCDANKVLIHSFGTMWDKHIKCGCGTLCRQSKQWARQ